MKMITLFALLLVTVSLTSCGGKDGGGGGSKAFTNQLSSREGYYNVSSQALEVGGVTYPANQAYATVMNQAIQQAQAQGIQPIDVGGGVFKFKATITASINNYSTGYTNSGYQQNPYQTQYGQQTLNLQSVVFHR